MPVSSKTHPGGSAIAVGNFDGYHLGHQKIVDTLIHVGKKRGLSTMILTFAPNPKLFFKQEDRLIISDREKKTLLNRLPVDRVVFLNFNTFYLQDGLGFLQNVLIERYRMAHIVVGENFRFGKNRRYDVKSLADFSSRLGFGVTVVRTRKRHGVKISSSLIRKKLMEGRVEEAKSLLGRPYYVDGRVIPGQGRGRELGFPTINIRAEDLILPHGVFKTRIRIGRKFYESITNIGYRPTFRTDSISIETHVFDFDRMVYGKPVRIFFEKKIRNEHKFESKTDLVRQIKNDIQKIEVDKGSHI